MKTLKTSHYIMVVAIMGLLAFLVNENRQGILAKTVFIERVIDGDTYVTRDGVHLRLIGINCPELKEKYGQAAKEFAEELVLNRRATIKYGKGKHDVYGRTLVYIYVGEERMINQILLIDGYAEVMTVKPNVKYAEFFQVLEDDAKKERVGMWIGGY